MARCLIIGANGFLGSHLVDELHERGHAVTAFDRFSGDVTNYSSEPVARIAGDFLNRSDVALALKNQDFVFHFLSTTTPATAEDDPTLDVRTNIASSIDLLSLSVEAGISRFYFASTGGAIYGDQPGVILNENAVPQPVSPYAIGKLAIEGYLRYFDRKYGLASVVFRISNPYGPRQRPGRMQGVIPIFLNAMKLGIPVRQFGDGSMVRDYIYVSDAVRMIADAVENQPQHRVYNIGSGVGTTVAKVLQTAREVTGLSPEVLIAPIPPTFVASSVLAVDRYRAEFGRQDILTLREGIERTWSSIHEAGA